MYEKMLSERRKYYESVIRDEANRIRELMKDGQIYGEVLDMDNINHLIVGAFYCGRAQGQQEYTEHIESQMHRAMHLNSVLK